MNLPAFSDVARRIESNFSCCYEYAIEEYGVLEVLKVNVLYYGALSHKEAWVDLYYADFNYDTNLVCEEPVKIVQFLLNHKIKTSVR